MLPRSLEFPAEAFEDARTVMLGLSTFIFPVGLLLFQGQNCFVQVDFQKARLADLRTTASSFVIAVQRSPFGAYFATL